MVGNKALGRELHPGTSALEVSTGNLLSENITPTIADLGGEIKITSKHIEFGKDGTRVPLNTEFDVNKLSVEDANALHTAAKTRTDIKPGDSVNIFDIPKLTAIRSQGIKDIVYMDGKQNVTGLYRDVNDILFRAKVKVGGDLIKKSNIAQAAAQAAGEKTALAEGALTPTQIARYIDTGPSFVEKISAFERIPESSDGTGKLSIENFLDHDKDIPFWSDRTGVDPTKPSYVMIDIDRRAMEDDNWIKGTVATYMRNKGEREYIDGIVADYWGKDYEKLLPSAYQTDSNFGLNISSVDSTSSLVKNSNAEFTSGMNEVNYVGREANRLTVKKHTEVNATFDAQKVMLASDQDAIYEHSVLDLKLRQTTRATAYQFIPRTVDEYLAKLMDTGTEINEEAIGQLADHGILDKIFPALTDAEGNAIPENQNRIWSKVVRAKLDEIVSLQPTVAGAELDVGDAISELTQLFKENHYSIKNERLGKFVRTHQEHNATEIVPHKNQLYAAQGLNLKIDPEDIYPGTIDTTRFKYHAIVVPTSAKGFMGATDPGMILASSAADLESKVNQAKAMFGGDVNVYTDPQVAAYKKVKADYDYLLQFRDSHMDSLLKRQGKAWDAVVEPDAELFNQWTNSLKSQHTGLIRTTIQMKYGEEVAALREQASQADLYNSTFGKKTNQRNVFKDALNIMLDKRPDDQDGIWNVMNAVTSDKFAKGWAAVRGAIQGQIKTGDWQLMNEKLKDYGIPQVYTPANQLILRNLNAPKPVLERIMSKANAFVGTAMLRLDNAQGIINLTGAPIMTVPEFSALTKSLTGARIKVLRDGTSVTVPGTDIKFPSSAAMGFQAVKNLSGEKGAEILKRYKAEGHVTNSVVEAAQLAEDFAKLAGESDPNKVETFLDKAIRKAATFTDWSEQFGKAISANMAEQVLDTLKIPAYQRAPIINTFVNRIHGNYLASQRPSLFQGWMGQAVGLFQTYQFNLIQSFLRHVESGDKGAVAKMVGLQAGLFGAQSVPGFQAMNNYIGQRSAKNSDFYSTTSGMLGETAGNFLLYGLASSATIPITGQGIDLYSRGDLTPRTPILIPTSPSEIPAVSTLSNFISSVVGAASKVADGAPIASSMLEALGHNGLNRPLQGLAQLISGQRTTKDGKLLVSYQGWDAWNVATKLLGTKTLDEAVAASSFYRTVAYQTARQKDLDSLGESYREVVRAGLDDSANYQKFMSSYTEKGGRAGSFNRWVLNNHKSATESQITTLRRNNNSPQGRYLQQVMGADVDDITGSAVE